MTPPRPKRLKPNRIAVGKLLRLHWELHLEFPDVEIRGTLETPPKLSKFGARKRLDDVWPSHWTKNQREEKVTS